MRRIGVFGGSFSPVHRGHLKLAREAASRLGLDRVIFVPTARTPLKDPRRLLPAELRVRLLREALKARKDFRVSRIEIERGGTSYTVDTLTELKRRSGAAVVLYLLCGADALARFGRWKSPERILRLARVVAFSRPGSRLPSDRRFIRLPMGALDISSTRVRRQLRRGAVDRRLVPSGVARLLARGAAHRRKKRS
ncbi:MAG: Nicotinate-nucleotide adenylyltransferase [Candidatus Omnitrophica bacterium]|nr:Nicotinate-nucleotide adenylyltransferase [Candidatus Omnitrophota bacterium]